MSAKDDRRNEARATLRKMLKPGDNVKANVLHVSRSGMMRVISLEIVHEGEIFDISGLAARAIGWTFDDRGGVKVQGCGMDMTFHVVYTLSRALFPNGHRCTSKTDKYGRHVCPSNDHANGDRRYDGRKPLHRDGGYALGRV